MSDLTHSVNWYQQYMGMEIEHDLRETGFVIMSLALSHQPEQKSLWVPKQAANDAYIGKVDGPVRPYCRVAEREEFFRYHTFLSDSGIEVSDIGGFLTRGLACFHFYDPDGNRLNISTL